MHLPIPFRLARPRSTLAHLLWTAVQSAAIWGLALALVPTLLVAMERRVGMPGFDFAGRPVVAVALLVLSSALNLATGAVLASRGQGTPFPLACPRTLVVTGPYRFVRNPMAIAGIGQGLAVALLLGSWLVFLYACAGATVWHMLIRPAEEHDLAVRFVNTYKTYQHAVPLWWPRLRAYAPPAT